jgi:hypothetical protein
VFDTGSTFIVASFTLDFTIIIGTFWTVTIWKIDSSSFTGGTVIGTVDTIFTLVGTWWTFWFVWNIVITERTVTVWFFESVFSTEGTMIWIIDTFSTLEITHVTVFVHFVLAGRTWTGRGIGGSFVDTGITIARRFTTGGAFVTTWLTGVTVIILTFWTYTLWRVDSSLFTDITTVSIATSQTFIFTSSTKSFTIIIKSISTWT